MSFYGEYIGELDIYPSHAEQAAHQGQCDQDVFWLSQLPYVKKQLAKIGKRELVKELTEYGAWEPGELADHAANLQRILWLACGDIVDGQH